MKRASSSCYIFSALCLLLPTWSIAGIACRACYIVWHFLFILTHKHTHTHANRNTHTPTHAHTHTHTHAHTHTHTHTHTHKKKTHTDLHIGSSIFCCLMYLIPTEDIILSADGTRVRACISKRNCTEQGRNAEHNQRCMQLHSCPLSP